MNTATFQFRNPDPKAFEAAKKNLTGYKTIQLQRLAVDIIEKINQYSFILFDKKIDLPLRISIENVLNSKQMSERDNCLNFIGLIYTDFKTISLLFGSDKIFESIVRELVRYGFISGKRVEDITLSISKKKDDQVITFSDRDNSVTLKPEYGWLNYFQSDYSGSNKGKILASYIVYLPPYLRCDAVDFIDPHTLAAGNLFTDRISETLQLYRTDDRLPDMIEFLSYIDPQTKSELKTRKPLKGFMRNLYEYSGLRPFFFEVEKTDTESLAGQLLMTYVRYGICTGHDPFELSSFLRSVSSFDNLGTKSFLLSALIPNLKGITAASANNSMFPLLWKAIRNIFLTAGKSDSWVNVAAITEYLLSSGIVSPTSTLLQPISHFSALGTRWKDSNEKVRPEEYYDKLIRQWTTYLILMLSVVGILEVAFDSNICVEDDSPIHVSAATLRYARLTKAGYFALGIVPKIVIPPTRMDTRLEIDNAHQLVRILPEGKVHRFLLMKMGMEISPDVFKITPSHIIGDGKSQEISEKLIKDFRERILEGKKYSEWERLFNYTIDRFTRITKSPVNYAKIIIKNPDSEIQRILSPGLDCMKYAVFCGNNTLFLPISYLEDITYVLKENGYYI